MRNAQCAIGVTIFHTEEMRVQRARRKLIIGLRSVPPCLCVRPFPVTPITHCELRITHYFIGDVAGKIGYNGGVGCALAGWRVINVEEVRRCR